MPLPAHRRALVAIETATPRSFFAGSLGLPIALGAAGVGLGEPVGWVLGGVAALLGVGGALAARHRRQVRSLPLCFASCALMGTVDGCSVYRFRVMLGRGRTMHKAHATVHFHPSNGSAPIPLGLVLAQAEVLLGPWTLVAVDRDGRTREAGHFEVSVNVVEAGERHTLQRSWRRKDVQPGRFSPGLHRVGRRIHPDPATWDRVLPAVIEGP